MTEFLNHFHFIRPLWLLALPLIPLWLWLRYRRLSDAAGWERIIPQELLQPLMPEARQNSGRRSLLLALLLSASLVAMAGPSWRSADQPVQQSADSLVVVLDVSLSMLSDDLSPNRLTRAKRKLRDLLVDRQGGETALIAYSGDAHLVTPLTRDRRTTEALLPALDPFMMPSQGGRADRGIAQAVDLLNQSGRGHRHILLITDGVRSDWHKGIHEALAGTDIPLNILAVGTEAGGPIPLEGRGVIRDGGEVVIVRTELPPLQALAERHGGQAVRITPGLDDLQQLALAPTRGAPRATDSDTTVSLPRDDGYWLLFLVLPLALLAWRRGHFSATVPVLAVSLGLFALPQPAMATSLLSDLFKNRDQQAMAMLEEEPEDAVSLFTDPNWKATAWYRAGEYERAAEIWARDDSAAGHYNRGNALARSEQLQDAIAAYNAALERQPDFREARENRDLLKELLEQQSDASEPDADGENGEDNGDNGTPPPGQPDDRQDTGPEPDALPPEDGSGEEGNGEAEPEPPEGPPEEPDEGPPDQADQGPEQEAAQPPPDPQTHDQWLRRIPDNPASLLQRKFEREYHERQRRHDPQENRDLW